ncbi:hypothetical protein [Pseudomonas fluorescens]|uniref:hypothetical protein n=1 Tax=Pseudomonas fluorescens TaxID=294 RepID=UPI00099AA419|nr:hypothetical protein [Pseudomonas fluorescens]
MNAHELTNTRAAKKVAIALGLLLFFMVLSNLLSGYANMTAGANLKGSVIGAAIQNAFYESLGKGASSKFSLAQDEVANRLVIPEKNQAYLTLPRAAELVAMGNIDQGAKAGNGWKLGGWTYVPESYGTPEFVIAVENEKVIGVLAIDVERPDVAKALNAPRALRTGYSGQITRQLNTGECKVTLYTLTSSLQLFAMPSLCDKANHSAQ